MSTRCNDPSLAVAHRVSDNMVFGILYLKPGITLFNAKLSLTPSVMSFFRFTVVSGFATDATMGVVTF